MRKLILLIAVLLIPTTVCGGGLMMSSGTVAAAGGTMRPTDYYDQFSDATNEANAYDNDSDTTSSVTVIDGPGTVVSWGRNSGNSDAWTAEPTCSTATLYVTLAREESSASIEGRIQAEASSGFPVYGTLIADDTAAQAKTTRSLSLTSHIGDLADIRLKVRYQTGSTGYQIIEIYEAWIVCE